MQGEILAHQRESSLPKVHHEGWGQEVAENGYGTSKDVESACGGDGSHRKINIEEAGGGSSG